ncbi:CHASE2 domain-containing serine/threonine-protein kinase [Halotia branconii]|uniref:non-specific serine/threonine protein kinase n=1 Tax=Halotia branconii CENA392 TaxID=1539056 RepID=A0AAJ6P835_9CYAN|nr:CHASE2 domain-containing serine/threonine-protein kinase [Halotia branconii]WGV24222.1 CHASE2 domain-containing serine/threonine-protein kinase [Halotia branconii CENA392]
MRNLFALPAIASSVVVTILLSGLQQLGILQPLELRVFDQMMQLRTNLKADSRLLIVEVTEADIKNLKFPLPGTVLNTLLNKLEEYEPRVIGLDIFRDLPVEPGHTKLLEHLKLSDIIVPVCKQSNVNEPAIPPPDGIEPLRVGFSDIVEDPDGAIRRNLLLHEPAANDPCATPYSFSLQLALKYLEVGGIQPQFTSKQELKLGNTLFKPLRSNSGGYQNVDDGGYQILLNYRSGKEIAQRVTVTDVLSDKVNPDLVKDRIVLIGSTAVSLKDIFNTPYSSGKLDNSGKMPGVVIHAHSVSQILSAVLKPQQPLFWFLPQWAEVVWIFVWSLAGGLIASRIQHPMPLGIASGVVIAVLIGSNFFIFTQAGWIPVVSPAFGLVLGAGSMLGYTAYQSKQEQEEIAQRVQEQQEAIAQLQALLRQGESSSIPTTEIIYPVNIGQEIPLNTLLSNRYKIAEHLGGGGFSRTYLALDTQRPGNPQCVVKQLKPANQETQYLKVVRRLFNTEADILEVLGKHQQIPQLLAYFEENQQFYLVQEFIKGYPLNKEISPGKRLSELQVIELLKDVLQVLSFVHSYSVIHRDIKPNNLIRREDGRIVLIDFGAVKLIQPQREDNYINEIQENQTIAIVTPGYAPSEQTSGQPKLNSDIYALGIVAIQALTGVDPRKFGRNPNTGELVVLTQANGISQYWHELAQVSHKLITILDRMVKLDFTKRYQSVTEVLKSLESLKT